MEQKYLTLDNGARIPQMGFGTFQIEGDANTKEAVEEALKAGYRHIDTAHAYQNERGVGQAVKESGIPRAEVWITSKLWVSDYADGKAAASIDKMLKRLDTDYLDLLLIHQQFGAYMDAWRAMEDAVRAGKVRSIGLSNFYGDRMHEVIEKSEIKPSVLQLECHPYYQQKEMRKNMASVGSVLEAWYPLGHGDKALLNEQVFTELGEKYHKSNAQIILRWHMQEGIVVFPKSTNPDHIRSNFNIFDFELTEDEMDRIRALDKNESYYDFFAQPLEDQEKMMAAFVPED